MKLGILGSATGIYVNALARAGKQVGADVRVLSFADLHTRLFGIGESGVGIASVHIDGQEQAPLDDLDAVLVRSMPLGSLEQVIFRMDCLHVLHDRGVFVINAPRCLETSIDKWLTLHRLAQQQIPVPATVACQSRDQAMLAFDVLGRDVLVKPLFGGEGRGIIRLQDPDLAWRTFSTLAQLGQVLYVQQFIANFGYDIRVLLIGERTYSIQRHAASGSYRANVSMGGKASVHELSAEHFELARRSADAVGGEVVGVDLLPGVDGQCWLLEVNAVPGWRGVQSVHNVDIAGQIVDHVMKRV